jgi:hypothetical protein
VTDHRDAASIEFEQVLSDLFNRMFGLCAVASPTLRAQSGKAGSIAIHSEIAGDAIRLVDGNVKLVTVRIRNQQILPLKFIQGSRDQSLESAHSIVHMHHVVTKS